MSKQDHTAAGGALSLERLVFFSDAVFAIAITLLILEIEVPHFGRPGEAPDFGHALLRLIPQFFAFALSFLVIGRFWMAHHQVMDHVNRFHPGLMWPNLLLLMSIAFMPFSTAVLGSNLGQFGPALFYNFSLLATALLGFLLVERIVRLGINHRDLGGERAGSLAVVVGASISVLLTFVTPQLSQWGMVTIPLWVWLFNRRRAA